MPLPFVVAGGLAILRGVLGGAFRAAAPRVAAGAGAQATINAIDSPALANGELPDPPPVAYTTGGGMRSAATPTPDPALPRPDLVF